MEIDIHLIKERVANLRLKLLDLSKSNPLLKINLKRSTSSYIRIVDELPDELAYSLTNGVQMDIVPLPGLEDEPLDECEPAFQHELTILIKTDEKYLQEVGEIDTDDSRSLKALYSAERHLRDRLRANKGMKPLDFLTSERLSQRDIKIHAEVNGIRPEFELPEPGDEHDDGRHTDEKIQTLLLPSALEKCLTNIKRKADSSEKESGVSILKVAVGLLEWSLLSESETNLSPLVLIEVDLSKRKTAQGVRYSIGASSDAKLSNRILAEKLRQVGVDIPDYLEGSIEHYLTSIQQLNPTGFAWKVRREVIVGVFPSSRMEMYFDLDPENEALINSENIIRVLHGMGGSSGSLGDGGLAEEYEIDAPQFNRKIPQLVMDADSSQHSTIIDVLEGQSVAVEGPPGSGKSQTIVNVIAAALSEGKKVLFVASKSAALEVVKARLQAIGLGEFLLTLQPEQSDKKRVYQSIKDRLDIPVENVEQNIEIIKRQLESKKKLLGDYIEVMSSQFGCTGMTVYQAIGGRLRYEEFVSHLPSQYRRTNVNYEDLTPNKIDEVCELTDLLRDSALGINESKRTLWDAHGRQSVSRIDTEELFEKASLLVKHIHDASNRRSELEGLIGAAAVGLWSCEEFEEFLDAIAVLSNERDRLLVVTICESDNAKGYQEECEIACRFSETMATLDERLNGPNDADSLVTIKKIIALLKRSCLGSLRLDLDSYERDREAACVALRKLQDVSTFVTKNLSGLELGYRGLFKASALIASTPTEVFSFRSEALESRANRLVCKRIIEAIHQTKALRETAERHLNLSVELSGEEINQLIEIFQKSGPFSFFGQEYRNAKAKYSRASIRRGFSKHTAIRDLELLRKFESNVKSLGGHAGVGLLGPLFDSIDTDTSAVSDVLAYYDAIDDTLKGLHNKQIRKLLHSEDIDALYSFGEFGESLEVDDLDVAVVESKIVLQQLEEKVAVSKELHESLPLFKAPEGESIESLVGLESILADFLAMEEQLAGGSLAAAAAVTVGNLVENIDQIQKAVDVAAGLVKTGADAGAVLKLGASGEGAATAREKFGLVKQDTEIIDGLILELCDWLQVDEGHPCHRLGYEAISEAISESLVGDGALMHYAKYNFISSALTELGFGWVVDTFDARADLVFDLTKAIKGHMFYAIGTQAAAKHPKVFANPLYQNTGLDEAREQFKKLDRKMIVSSRLALRHKLAGNAEYIEGVGYGRKSGYTERSLIEHQLTLNRNHTPIRNLTLRAGRSLRELKPCWMMSPLSVARYLPSGHDEMHFDLCIIDEASQMPPEEAMGALARCQQVMVVGDTNQLPPTNFFGNIVVDDELDEDEVVLEESILELANNAFKPRRRLRWHYRSKYPELINFSNRLVYDGHLVIFPSPASERSPRPVSLVSVDGVYGAKVNVVEAEVMCNAIEVFMGENPTLSLGVVTLNQPQAMLLSDMMEQRQSASSVVRKYVHHWNQVNDGLESFFVKNLENVQGDERDAIFIGTVYAKDEGRPFNNGLLGPLNGISGKRRLNVLFTRAKHRIITFSSLNANDISVNGNQPPGRFMLKKWLEYSVSGHIETGLSTGKEPDSMFEVYVIEQLQAMGCEPIPQVGASGYFIDIGVKHPSYPHGFIMAVECDGATYHSSKSARDRDRLRQEILEGQGWFFHRIWSTNWFNDAKGECDKLRTVIEARLEQLSTKLVGEQILTGDMTELVDTVEPELVFEEQEAENLVQTIETHIDDESSQTEGGFWDEIDEGLAQDIFDFTPHVNQDDANGECVELGDVVHVSYRDENKNMRFKLVDKGQGDVNKGKVAVNAPLGMAVLDLEVGEEVEVIQGAYVHMAVIEKIEKRAG